MVYWSGADENRLHTTAAYYRKRKLKLSHAQILRSYIPSDEGPSTAASVSVLLPDVIRILDAISPVSIASGASPVRSMISTDLSSRLSFAALSASLSTSSSWLKPQALSSLALRSAALSDTFGYQRWTSACM